MTAKIIAPVIPTFPYQIVQLEAEPTSGDYIEGYVDSLANPTTGEPTALPTNYYQVQDEDGVSIEIDTYLNELGSEVYINGAISRQVNQDDETHDQVVRVVHHLRYSTDLPDPQVRYACFSLPTLAV